ncbi:MAG: DUF4019 domain-containing protein [Steroidobacteraceae bacterium]
MKRFAGIGLLAVSLVASIQGLTAATPVVATAARGAQAWLGLLDTGDYSQTWSTAAKHLRDSISESQWISRLSEERGSQGAVQSRSLESAEFVPSKPGAPEGEHVVIRFATDFEHHAGATETEVLIKDSDGQWRVDAYSIT